MKNLLRTSLLIFAFCLSAFSQTDTNSVCPKLEVFGPAGITNPGETMIYTANLDKNAEKYSIEYIWSVNNGTVIEGQGTPIAKILPNDLDTNITATVEIKGLPEGCTNAASETAGIAICKLPIVLDEFSISPRRIEKARIDVLLTELQNNPNDQGYIIEKFERKTSKAIINQKMKKLREYIVKSRKFDASRITIVHDLADENLTQFFQVPPGAENPTIK